MMYACPVTVRGKHYPSIKSAAAAHGRSERQAQRHLDKYGHLDFLGQAPPRWTRPDRHKACAIAGMRFESMTAAARALGLDRKTLRNARTCPAARQTVMAAAMQYSAL